jgi:hypothetical protein
VARARAPRAITLASATMRAFRARHAAPAPIVQ